MKHKLFRKIVGTKLHACCVFNLDTASSRTVCWKNTNELLGSNFYGIKTGITKNAGPCLCAFYSKNCQQVIVVVLGASSKEQRWVDVPKLAEWGVQQFKSWV